MGTDILRGACFGTWVLAVFVWSLGGNLLAEETSFFSTRESAGKEAFFVEQEAFLPEQDTEVKEAPFSPQERVALHFVEEGKAALEKANLDLAWEQFEKAVTVAPLQPYAYYFLGHIAFGRGRLTSALAFLRKAELLFPQDDGAWLGETTCLRGVVAEDLGDLDQARSAYQRCLEFTPRNLRALTALARLSEEEESPYEVLGLPIKESLPREPAFP